MSVPSIIYRAEKRGVMSEMLDCRHPVVEVCGVKKAQYRDAKGRMQTIDLEFIKSLPSQGVKCVNGCEWYSRHAFMVFPKSEDTEERVAFFDGPLAEAYTPPTRLVELAFTRFESIDGQYAYTDTKRRRGTGCAVWRPGVRIPHSVRLSPDDKSTESDRAEAVQKLVDGGLVHLVEIVEDHAGGTITRFVGSYPKECAPYDTPCPGLCAAPNPCWGPNRNGDVFPSAVCHLESSGPEDALPAWTDSSGDLPIKARYSRGLLRIHVSPQTLAYIATEIMPDSWGLDPLRARVVVPDAGKLAEVVAQYLNEEEEDGSTVVGRCVEQAMINLAEQGETCIEIIEDEEEEEDEWVT